MDGQTERAIRDQRLSVILDVLAEAVTIRAKNNHIVYANQAALDRLGFDSVAALRDADPRALMGTYETTDEQGNAIEMDDLPSVALLRGETPEPLLMRSVDRASGEESWMLLKAAAVLDDAGEIESAVTIIADVTDATRSTQRVEFLARIGELLASSLDYQQTLRNVAGLAVPQIADWCAVDLFDADGGREPVAIAHSQPEKLELAKRMRTYEPGQLDPEQGLGKVLRTGEPVLYTEIPDELLVGAAVDEEHLRLLRAVGMRAVLIVALKVAGRPIGALTMVNSDSGRTFNADDVEFAEQIASRAAVAVQSARLYSERSAVARTLQNSLLPEAIPEIPGWDVAALYRAAGHESEVGGDFYDFWEVGEDWLMMIGDVTGKGVGAAALTSLVRYTARAASEFDARPREILARIDAALRRRHAVSLCTALCVRLSRDGATLSAGGHPLPMSVGDDGVAEVGEHGTLLGALRHTHWPETQIPLYPGQTLVAFTDGVTDTVGEGGERWGTERLASALAAAGDRAPAGLRTHLLQSLDGFQVGEQADDTAVVIMRFTGQAPQAEARRDISSVGATRNG